MALVVGTIDLTVYAARNKRRFENEPSLARQFARDKIAFLREDVLDNCGYFIYVGPMFRFDRDVGERVNSGRALAVCEEKTFRQLRMAFPEVPAFPFDLESYNPPNKDMGENWTLHVSNLPRDMLVGEAEDFISQILKRLIDPRDFMVSFAMKSRETGETKGFGRVVFNEEVDEMMIKLCKLILHNTVIQAKSSEETHILSCSWLRPPKPSAQKGPREPRESREDRQRRFVPSSRE